MSTPGMPPIVAGLLVVGIALGGAASGGAQPVETRREALRQVRLEKAQRLQPYTPGRLERWLVRVENDRLLERLFLTSDGGWYARVGSVTTGGGVAAGPGYRRRHVGGRRVDVGASATISMKKYWLAETTVTFPDLADGLLFGDLFVRHRDFPQEDFFGPGPDARRADRVSYRYRDTGAGGGVGVRPAGWLAAGSRVEFLSPRVSGGTDSRLASIEQLFGDAEAPGLAVQPDFVRLEGWLDLNYSEPPGNPRSGGQYLVSHATYADRGGTGFGFSRTEVDLRQYLSVLQQRRVLALRAFVSLSDPQDGARVPFYLQRTLGGATTLRGFREYRFRDANLLLLQAEYRWEIFPALDAAIFYDAGMVAPRPGDLTLKRLERDYGFGFRFGTINGVFLRLDTALGSGEGPHFFIKFGHVF
jgi:outer membrane protein assembly factor BamA